MTHHGPTRDRHPHPAPDEMELALRDLCRAGGHQGGAENNALLALLADATVVRCPPPATGLSATEWREWLGTIITAACGSVLTAQTRDELVARAFRIVSQNLLLLPSDMPQDWRVLAASSIRAACDKVPVDILEDMFSHLSPRGRVRVVTAALGSPLQAVREWGIAAVPKLPQTGTRAP